MNEPSVRCQCLATHCMVCMSTVHSIYGQYTHRATKDSSDALDISVLLSSAELFTQGSQKFGAIWEITLLSGRI
jgi:hypothetical protein